MAMLPGDARLQVDDLVLRLPNGEAMASFGKVELAPGDRLLVTGASGTGKSSFFRALSGLWPLGEGTIHFPEHAKVFTLPQRAYFPLGSLRQAIAYPTQVEHADDAAIREALRAVGLAHLTDRLDEEADWPTVLAGGEQQRAAFARALLAKPDILSARRAGLRAGGGRRRRALPPARRAAAARHRHHRSAAPRCSAICMTPRSISSAASPPPPIRSAAPAAGRGRLIRS